VTGVLSVEQNAQLRLAAPQYAASTIGLPTGCEYDRKFVGRCLSGFNAKPRTTFGNVENHAITQWCVAVRGHFCGDLNGSAYMLAIVKAHRIDPCKKLVPGPTAIARNGVQATRGRKLQRNFSVFLQEILGNGHYRLPNCAVRRNPHADDCLIAAVGSKPSAVRSMRARSDFRYGLAKSSTPGSSRP
jgi:hypothetical protein